MLRLWSLTLATTIRNPRRSLLTIGSIAASLCLLSVLVAACRAVLGRGSRKLLLADHPRTWFASRSQERRPTKVFARARSAELLSDAR